MTTSPEHLLNTQSELLSIEQGAVLIGVSVATFRRHGGRPGFPPAIPLGRLRRWSRTALLAWAEGRTAEGASR